MYHYTNVLSDILEEAREPTHNSNRKLSSKARKRQQRNNRKLKNAFFTKSVENKWYEKPHFQSQVDNVMDKLGYY